MDDSIKDRLKDIIAKRDADGKGSAAEREASAKQREDVFLALWKSRLAEVVLPAFAAFSKHLLTTYKISSHVAQDEPVGAFKPRGDPCIRFVFADPPRLGHLRSEASFFEIQGDPRAQTWATRVEIRDGDNVRTKSEQAPVPFDELGSEWIHERLADVLALSYGQPVDWADSDDGEPTSEEESTSEEEPTSDQERNSEEEATSKEAPISEDEEAREESSEAPPDETPDRQETPAEDEERPDAEGRDSDRQKSPDEPTPS